jgi:hypothetical protein
MSFDSTSELHKKLLCTETELKFSECESLNFQLETVCLNGVSSNNLV